MRKKTREKVKSDVELVKSYATVVLTIKSDNTVEFEQNENPRLNVIAVLGPSFGFGQNFNEVLLAEIGISRTRPYSEVKGLNREPWQSNIPERKKIFSLRQHQYQLVAPLIFKKMEELALERVLKWKKGPFSDDPFWIISHRNYWSRHQKTLFTSNPYRIRSGGARFAVSLKDEFLVRDIYWAELYLNQSIKVHIKGMVKFIDLRLNWYKRSYKHKRSFTSLKGVKQVRQQFERSSLSRHLLIEVMSRLKQEKRNQFWPYLAEMIDWNGKDSEEKKLASLACSQPKVPHPKSRLDDIQLRVTTNLDRGKEYIVFEVFPRQK